MLNFIDITHQIEKMINDNDLELKDNMDLNYARKILKQTNENFDEFQKKLAKNKNRTSFLIGEIKEKLDTTYDIKPPAENFSIIATDGSQITPDHHEIAPCYLVSIGKIALTYGSASEAIIENNAQIFYKQEDLYPIREGQRVTGGTELVYAMRDIMEIEAIIELIVELQKKYSHPIIALVDGSLIKWQWYIKKESKDKDFRMAFLEQYLKLLGKIYAYNVPTIGYISGTRSNDIVNSLKLYACPKDKIDCDNCDDISCQRLLGINDRIIFSSILAPKQHTGIFRSCSRVIEKEYPEKQKTCFMYMNVGSEVVRLEFPQWLAENEKKLELSLSLIYDQAQKGLGYPITLIEAHEQAVVRGADRGLFYQMLQNALIKSGRKTRISNKLLSKRTPRI